MTEREILSNEITLASDVQYTIPSISFAGYEEAKRKAEDVAAYIRAAKVTDDNVSEIKKLLANARKLVSALDDRRKDIKKEITAPVKAFEEQVKDITAIIDEADGILRSQIRELEEKEREAKQKNLQEIWNLRVDQYTFYKYVPDAFTQWLEPKHLNKSTSVKAAEEDMVSFMERVEKDI